jgi:hypothetical protein
MYWTRRITRADLEGGHVLAHGLTRLDIAPADLRMFVDPKDAALLFAFRALQPEDDFQKSIPVWMATLRRAANGKDAIVESIVRAFTKIADETSLERLLHALVDEARRLGGQKPWFVPGLFGEPLFKPALKRVLETLEQAIIVNPTTGMTALQVLPTRG